LLPVQPDLEVGQIVTALEDCLNGNFSKGDYYPISKIEGVMVTLGDFAQISERFIREHFSIGE